VNKIAVVNSKVDDKTMKAEVYQIDSSGELGAYPWGTAELKRKD